MKSLFITSFIGSGIITSIGALILFGFWESYIIGLVSAIYAIKMMDNL